MKQVISLNMQRSGLSILVLAAACAMAACASGEAARDLTTRVARTADTTAQTTSPIPAAGPPAEPRSEPTPAPTPLPTPEPLPTFEAPVLSISMPSIRVAGAPLVPMNVRNGYMDLPYNPYQVAWYDFTAKPGMGGNAVFSAHVDYIRHGPAVFAGLHRLQPDDEVLIRLQDGTLLHYAVLTNEMVPLASLDMRQVLAPVDGEITTLITCGGYFDGYDYSHRVVVVARRTGVETPG